MKKIKITLIGIFLIIFTFSIAFFVTIFAQNKEINKLNIMIEELSKKEHKDEKTIDQLGFTQTILQNIQQELSLKDDCKSKYIYVYLELENTNEGPNAYAVDEKGDMYWLYMSEYGHSVMPITKLTRKFDHELIDKEIERIWDGSNELDGPYYFDLQPIRNAYKELTK